jgi:hypothetical protein
MRIQLLILLVTLNLVASARAAVATPAATTGSPSGPAEAGQTATWTPRKLVNFAPSVVKSLADGPLTCDGLVGDLRLALLQLGARESDLHIDERGCRAGNHWGVDATFVVLASADGTGKNAADVVAEARWQTVELRTERVDRLESRHGLAFVRTCDYLEYLTKKVLPLFSVRDVKLIPAAVCEKTDVGLRAQVLMPAQQLSASH